MSQNQGKYHLVSIFLIPAVLVAYLIGGIPIGLTVTVISAIVILLVFRKN
jgi:hypothetical protein